MRTRKKIISFVLLAVFVFTFVACSGTKNVCPAYSINDTESAAVYPG
jgi:hypothetical protein